MPEDRPVVSVLVLAYNHERFIGRCLDGILSQDLDEPIEVIVGEDCSTDRTREVVEGYVGAHPGVVRLVTAASNVGMHENHHRLLRASTGDFVAHCEGDDYWHAPDKLRLQVAALRAHPSHSGVHSDVDHLVLHDGSWRRREQLWAAQRRPRGALTTYADLVERNRVQTCSVLLRGDVARSYPASRLAAARYAVDDWPLFLHATSSGPLALLPRSLATYRSVAGSATNLGAAANERRVRDQYRLITDASDGRPELAPQRRAGLVATRDALLLIAVEAGDPAMARRAVDSGREHGVHDARALVAAVAIRIPGVLALGRTLLGARQRRRLRRRYVPEPPDHEGG